VITATITNIQIGSIAFPHMELLIDLIIKVLFIFVVDNR